MYIYIYICIYVYVYIDIDIHINRFLCLFAVALPCETVFRVWDVLFYEGFSAAFRIALALFRMAEPQASGRPRLGGVGLSGKRR